MGMLSWLAELHHTLRSSEVALTCVGSLANRSLKIQVGLASGQVQDIAVYQGLPTGERPDSVEQGLADLPGRLRRAAQTRRAPANVAQDGRPRARISHRSAAAGTLVRGGTPKSWQVSENEKTDVVNFWNSLSSEEKNTFESMAVKRVFAAGARLMQEGDRANYVAVILDGWTEIRTRKNGRELVVARRGPGQLIGERAALQISVRSATVVAITPVEALVMHTEEFAAFVSDHRGVLDIVENQIFSRLTEEPVGCEHDQDQEAGAREAPARPRLDGAPPPSRGPRPQDSRPRLAGENATILWTDVVGFSSPGRTDDDRLLIRKAIAGMTRQALGTLQDLCRYEDRGDGHLIVAPPSIPTSQIVEGLLAGLGHELKRHNHIYSAAIQIRLRVAVNVGPVTEDDSGVSGESIIKTARMLEAPAFKEAMARNGAVLGIVVSPFVYDTAIRQGRASLDPADYTRILVEVKETRTPAWMNLIAPARTAFPEARL